MQFLKVFFVMTFVLYAKGQEEDTLELVHVVSVISI